MNAGRERIARDDGTLVEMVFEKCCRFKTVNNIIIIERIFITQVSILFDHTLSFKITDCMYCGVNRLTANNYFFLNLLRHN